MRLSDLQDKDIVSISDGKKIGSIIDVNIDEKGIMKSLVVEENKFMLFSEQSKELYFFLNCEKMNKYDKKSRKRSVFI